MSRSSSLKISLINQNRAFTTRRRYDLFNSTINELEARGSVNDSCRFISMSVLTSTMMMAEIVTGIVTGSLTLLSDALHMMSDLIALIIGFIAHRMANGNTHKNSFEHTMVYMRYEIVGALINGTILLTSCFIMGLEAIQRIVFFKEEIENVDYVLIVGGLGLFINLIGLCIFGHHGHSHHNHHHDHTHTHSHSHSHSHENMDDNIDIDIQMDDDHKHCDGEKQQREENLNIRGVFLHILGDLLGSVAVIISSLVIKFTNGWWTLYIDPFCTLIIVMLIGRTAWPLVRQSANILLDKSPFTSDIIGQIEKELRHISGVLNVHELRCWEVKTGYYMATVHLIIDPNWMDDDHTDKYCHAQCDILHDKMTIIDQSKAILHKYGIHSSIVQSEFPKKGDQDWEHAHDPCFDYVCNTSDCITKSKALSNSMANLKKEKKPQVNNSSSNGSHDECTSNEVELVNTEENQLVNGDEQ